MIKGLSNINSLPTDQASLQLQKLQVVMSAMLLTLLVYSTLKDNKKRK